jgi:hypothetical protein
MIDVWEERLVLFAIAILVAFTGWIFLFLVPEQFDREDKAKDLANGCIYLGHPKDLNTVFFYDCDGNIIMKRVK